MRHILALIVACLALKPALAAPLDLTPYRGKVVLVDFWASWCEPCRASFPWLATMQKRHGAQGLVVLTVNVDENKADAARFLRETPSSLPVFYDPKGEVAAHYQLLAMPTSLIFDRQGVLRYRHSGFLEAKTDDYEKHIRTVLRD